jgi:hypothetical protein
MQFTFEVTVSGAAFGDDAKWELSRLLSRAAGLVQSGVLSAPLLDGNGNRIGRFALKEI